MKFVMFLVGLLVVFVLGFLISADRKKIKYKPIVIMLVIQLALSYFLLNTQVGYILVKEFQMDLAHFLDMRKLESFSYLVVLLIKERFHSS